jgi:hypothetical protein
MRWLADNTGPTRPGRSGCSTSLVDAGRSLHRRSTRVLLGALAVSACALVGSQPARAVINDPNQNGPTEGPCLLGIYDFKLDGNFQVVGLPLTGAQVQIDATSAKITAEHATPARICEGLLFQISRVTWGVTAPNGESATITNGSSLSPGVKLGGPGAYKVRLTACPLPAKCTVTLRGKSKAVGPFIREITINAVNEFAPPPETEPLLPPLFAPGTGTNPAGWSGPTGAPPRFSDAQRSVACNGGSAAFPEWVTAGPFAGAASYRTVEGAVTVSRLANEDLFLTHNSHDQNWDVKPDAPYFGLPHPNASSSMEMEWEANSLPREFRPTAGDRASTVGFWIFDCGHSPFKAEIHPPVGIAVERPRAVELPSLFIPPDEPNRFVGLGTGLQVPGIVTDIFFNRRSGGLTSSCNPIGLHLAATSLGQLRPCILEPHSLNRRFTFNVYLPRDPQQRAQELGLSPPPVPVFSGVSKLSLGRSGPEPAVVVRRGGGATWLEVTVDLSSLPASEMQYARRISAAWAYPQAENWGARRWRVRLNSIDVVDNAARFGIGTLAGNFGGNWHFFFNTNNRDREWTQVFACDNGCISDGDTRSLNTETGSAAGSSQGLGPDLVLFPTQRILVHTTGFDNNITSGGIGEYFTSHGQTGPVAGDYTGFSQGGDGVYRVHYGIGGGATIARASLSTAGSSLLAAYTVRGTPPCNPPPRAASAAVGQVGPDRVCVVSAERRSPQNSDPRSFVLTKPVQKAKTLPVFEHEREEFLIPSIARSKLQVQFNSLANNDPRRLNALLDLIKVKLRAVPNRLRRGYFDFVATLDKVLTKNQAARAVPPGFRPK